MKNRLVLFLTCCGITLWAQDISMEQLRSDVTFLSSDAMQGRKVHTPENEMAAAYIVARFQSLGLEPCIGDSFFVPFSMEKEGKAATIDNVCAKKQGKTEDKLIVSAHFDHIGVSDAQVGDKIFNGTDDNASGVGAVLAIAKKLNQTETQKTIWYVGFNAEEGGLVGSNEMVKQLEDANLLESVKLVFNFEMLGTVSSFGAGDVFITGDDKSNLDEKMNAVAKNGFKVHEDPYKKFNLFYRSDNAPFAKKDVVAHSFSTVDMTKTKHYHNVTDDIGVMDFDNYYKVVNSLADAVLHFATTDDQPEYNQNK